MTFDDPGQERLRAALYGSFDVVDAVIDTDDEARTIAAAVLVLADTVQGLTLELERLRKEVREQGGRR